MAVANRYLQIRVQHLRMHHQPWVVLSAWGLRIHLHQQAQHPCSHPSPRVVQSVQASQRWLRLHKFKAVRYQPSQ